MIRANYLLVVSNIENERELLANWLDLTICSESEMRQLDENGSIVIRTPRGDNACIAATNFNTTYGGMLQACESDDTLWNHILCKTRIYDPKVVILDAFASTDSAEDASPEGGLEYATRLKEEYPDMGVVVLTSGVIQRNAPAVGTQEELDTLKKQKSWSIDAAWLRPWSEVATESLTPEQVQEKKKRLFDHSLRQSEN